jgi:hypothetical protein
MNDNWFNIRFGCRHLQIGGHPFFSWKVNPYWLENKPEKWFEIYVFFGRVII